MGRGRNKPQKGSERPSQRRCAHLPGEFRGERRGHPRAATINQAQAIAIRQNDGNVVVCGPNKTANSSWPDIEQAANGHGSGASPTLTPARTPCRTTSPTPEAKRSGTRSTRRTRNTLCERA